MSLKLTTYDNSLLRLQEDQELHHPSGKEPKTVLDYLHGSCHVFALAAFRVLGPEAKYCILSDFDSCEAGPQLMHAYVSYKDIMIDARGIIELEDLADYESNSSGNYDYFTLDEAEVIKNMECGIWHQSNEGELEELSTFIKQHLDFYTRTEKHKLASIIDKNVDPLLIHDFYEDLDFDLGCPQVKEQSQAFEEMNVPSI
ncbi:hypothetical protein [Vibrio owensii]|uniref:hypothetical protein n=1 Tax=Vibrio harveyi group TaxID=717610 RepID=UPI003CC59F23